MTYDVGNPSPILGQAPKCCRVKQVNLDMNIFFSSLKWIEIFLDFYGNNKCMHYVWSTRQNSM